MRASGLAQARLQLAVLSGNRRRALEQIDRLLGIDRQLERIARGESTPAPGAIEADLAEQRLAIASEKLALDLGDRAAAPRARVRRRMGAALAPDEPVEIVENATLRATSLSLRCGPRALRCCARVWPWRPPRSSSRSPPACGGPEWVIATPAHALPGPSRRRGGNVTCTAASNMSASRRTGAEFRC
jgi:hypothetical protein